MGTDLGTIRGTVTDAGGGGVIPGSSVTITDALRTATDNRNELPRLLRNVWI